MVSDAQVRLLRQKRMDGKTQAAAAASAGMSIRTAREWDTRAGAVGDEAVPRLADTTRSVCDGVADRDRALTAARYERRPRGQVGVGRAVRPPSAQFHPGQARTLQRRFRDWRALHGPEPEVYFEQVAVPGREAAIDFTHGTDLGVTIAGEPLPHLLFEFVLELQRVALGGRRLRRDVRGARRRSARRGVGARRRAGGAAQRQSLRGDPRVETQ